jgi:hypothetical protein
MCPCPRTFWKAELRVMDETIWLLLAIYSKMREERKNLKMEFITRREAE